MNATSLVPRLSFFQHDDTIVKNLIIYGQGVPQSEKSGSYLFQNREEPQF